MKRGLLALACAAGLTLAGLAAADIEFYDHFDSNGPILNCPS